ncbi:MAG: FHA domain-containing protein [Actinomycetota bacterium]
MRVKLLLSVTGLGDRIVEVGPRATAASLAAALDPGASATRRSLRVDRNGSVLAPDRPVLDLDLRSGDRVSLVAAEPGIEFDEGPDRDVRPSASLRMLTGPLAGQVFQLADGSSTVGRTADNDLVLKDPGISRRHALISVDASAVVVTDLGSTNGIRIEGLPIDGPTALRSGQRLLLGQSWVAVDHYSVAVSAVQGRVGFDRPQRMVPTYQGRTFQVPRPPDSNGDPARRGPLGSRMQSRQIDRAYATVIDRLVADVNLARREEREARTAESPSIDDVLLGVRSQTRLWERRLTDPDALQIRLGLAELPSRHRIEIEPGGPAAQRTRVDRLPQTYATIDGVPATVDLGRPGGLRLRGSLERTRPIAASLVAQLAGLNPPDQLGIVFHGDALTSWDWLKWLPHIDLLDGAQPPTGGPARNLINDLLAADPANRTELRDRPPYVVVIVDGWADDDELVGRLQAEGAGRGVHPLIIDERSTPNGDRSAGFGVGAVLTAEGPTARLHVPGDPAASVDPIAVERLETDVAVEFGRLLAPLTLGWPDPPEASGPDEPAHPATGSSADGNDDDGGTAGSDRTPDDGADDADGAAEAITVGSLVFGPALPPSDPMAPPDLFDLPRSIHDSRLVLGQVRMTGQAETILAFSPPRDGTLALVGAPGDDLTGCLLTVTAAVARFEGPAEAQPRVYALGKDPILRTIVPLPAVAGVVDGEPGAAVECLAELEQLMADRLLTFELAGVSDLDGFREARPGTPMRRVLVVIDGLGWLTSVVEPEYPGRTRQVVGQLLEIGSALGLHLVFTVDDRHEVDPLLAPKVGRWLELDGGDGIPGRVRLDGADVRFAVPGGSWAPARIEKAMIELVSDLVGPLDGHGDGSTEPESPAESAAGTAADGQVDDGSVGVNP